MSASGVIWICDPEPDEHQVFGPFHTAYLHTPPEGAPEPGERRVLKGYADAPYVVRHVYQNFSGAWRVAVTSEKSGQFDEFLLSEWLDLPLAPPKPKYRIPETVLTDEQAVDLNSFLRRNGAVAALIRIEEIPE